jgi:hypothetical protein
MAMTPEAKVKAAVVKLLKQYNVYYFSPNTHGYGRSGVPDIICCLNGGKFLAIECKAGKNQPTALQEREIRQIQLRRGLAMVVREDSIPLVEQVIKENSRE